jgi:pimeloyl-ACP methyl ester carboxylesterase
MRRALRVGVGVALAVLGLAAFDLATGTVYRTATAASLHVTPARTGATGRALVVFPGFAMPGDLLGEAFAPYLPPDNAMVVVHYAERGVDAAAISSAVEAELVRLSPKEVVVYGASMGGMLAREFLHHHDGRVVLVLDSSPSAADRTTRPGVVFWFARRYRGGALSTTAVAVAARFARQAPPEPDADPSLVARSRSAGRWVGTPALTSQASFVAGFAPLREGELSSNVVRAAYLRGHGPSVDPSVDVDASITDWRRALPSLTVVTLPGREAGWHIPLIERPHETMSAILSV